MPATKAHFKWKGFTIMSDSRDICLPGELDADIYDWARAHKISASIFIKAENNSIWRIMNDNERMLFKITWGTGE